MSLTEIPGRCSRRRGEARRDRFRSARTGPAGHLTYLPGTGVSLQTVTVRRSHGTRYSPFCAVADPSTVITRDARIRVIVRRAPPNPIVCLCAPC